MWLYKRMIKIRTYYVNNIYIETMFAMCIRCDNNTNCNSDLSVVHEFLLVMLFYFNCEIIFEKLCMHRVHIKLIWIMIRLVLQTRSHF